MTKDTQQVVMRLASMRKAITSLDWKMTSVNAGLYEVWEPKGGDGPPLFLPLDPGKGDFAGLVERAERSLHARYGRAFAAALRSFDASGS